MGLPSMEGVAGDVAGDVAVAQVRGAVLLLFSFLLFFFFFLFRSSLQSILIENYK